MRPGKGGNAMRQNWLLALVLGSAIIVLILPHRSIAEQIDPLKDLQKDVSILGVMVHMDLSKYSLPSVLLVPVQDYDHRLERMKDGAFVSVDMLGFYDCGSNRIEISEKIFEVAAKFEPKPMDPVKYFRVNRFHELYHWARCQYVGKDRYWSGPQAVSNEEAYARALELRFFSEQLGEFAAAPEDYVFPDSPQQMPEGSFPDESLRKQTWSIATENENLVPWRTKSGSVLFVGVVHAFNLVKDYDHFPNYDLPGQHLPNVNLSLSSGTLYLYDAVIHRRHYVGFEIFVLPDGEYNRGIIKSGAWSHQHSCWDAGYVPVEAGKEQLAPDNPVYAGKWVCKGNGFPDLK